MDFLNSDLFFAGSVMALGYLLMAVEFTIIPGFGVVGALGLAALTYGCLELAALAGPEVGLLAALVSVIVAVALTRSFLKSRRAKAFVLENEVQGTAVHAEEFEVLVGKHGRVSSALRPSGIVDVEGRRYDAVAQDGDFLEAGVLIEVVGHEHGQIRVAEKISDSDTPLC